jgi:hypothetical protein
LKSGNRGVKILHLDVFDFFKEKLLLSIELPEHRFMLVHHLLPLLFELFHLSTVRPFEDLALLSPRTDLFRMTIFNLTLIVPEFPDVPLSLPERVGVRERSTRASTPPQRRILQRTTVTWATMQHEPKQFRQRILKMPLD